MRSCRQVAGMFGVGQRLVGMWWRKYQAGGREAFAVQRTRRSGRPELVTDEERAAMLRRWPATRPRACCWAVRCGPSCWWWIWSGWWLGVSMTERGVGK